MGMHVNDGGIPKWLIGGSGGTDADALPPGFSIGISGSPNSLDAPLIGPNQWKYQDTFDPSGKTIFAA